jgi:predicted cobalt transporter CbtA
MALTGEVHDFKARQPWWIDSMIAGCCGAVLQMRFGDKIQTSLRKKYHEIVWF